MDDDSWKRIDVDLRWEDIVSGHFEKFSWLVEADFMIVDFKLWLKIAEAFVSLKNYHLRSNIYKFS